MQGRLASYLSVTCYAPVRVTGTGTGHSPIAMSDEEARQPLNIPSPNQLTESDDERQQSAQKPDTSNALNADSDRPVVSAISASEAMETADSGTKPRIFWHTIQVMDRDAMNDHEIQARLTEVARQEYEKGGTAFPPGKFINLYVFHFERIYSNHMNMWKPIQDSRTT